MKGETMKKTINGKEYNIEPGTDLRRTNLRGANLKGANLTRSCLTRADLRGADLRDADLSSADLRAASIWDADLWNADLGYANLRGANLTRSCLTRANLRGANLMRSCLTGADLRGASLCGADLCGADLDSADLRGAFLPSPTMVLMAYWGKVSSNLTIELMRYDASCHPDPTAFDRWAASDDGPCPYDDVKIQRACYFDEQRILWSPGPSKRPYDLMVEVIRECCKDSDYHGGENG